MMKHDTQKENPWVMDSTSQPQGAQLKEAPTFLSKALQAVFASLRNSLVETHTTPHFEAHVRA